MSIAQLSSMTRRRLALIFVLVGTVGAVFVLRDVRRFDVQFVPVALRGSCAQSLFLRVGPFELLSKRLTRTDYSVRMRLGGEVQSRWGLQLRKGSYGLEGALTCMSDREVPIGPVPFVVDGGRTIPLSMQGLCFCSNSTE